MTLIIKDRRYGCFEVIAICDECKKLLYNRGFSWEIDHIGINDTEKIIEIMEQKRFEKEINYCYKCGHSITLNTEVMIFD